MSKPKANRVTKRLDNFVNNNEIYILVVIDIVIYNYNIEDIRDNEY